MNKKVPTDPATFSAMSSYILDSIPTDVIHYCLFPYLDWNSRVTANTLVHPAGRVSVPLKKDSGISVMLRTEHDKLVKLFRFIDEYNMSSLEKYKHILTLMTAIKDIKYLLQYSKRFRETTISKIVEFSDIHSPEYEAGKIEYKDILILSNVCKTLLLKIDKLPYEREVDASTSPTWTAVTAGEPHIVQKIKLYDDVYMTRYRFRYYEKDDYTVD